MLEIAKSYKFWQYINSMRVLLLLPPLVQLNTPYPATCYLTGFLAQKGLNIAQADVGIELAMKLFSRDGLSAVTTYLRRLQKQNRKISTKSIRFFLKHSDDYINTIEAVIHFLQGNNPTLALRIVGRGFLPEGPRFESLNSDEQLALAFGNLGTQDLAKHLASLFLDDLTDVITQGVDSNFGLSKYAESLALSSARFEPISKQLERKSQTLLDQWIDNLTKELIKKHKPDLLGISVPFPGSLYGALRIAKSTKTIDPSIKIVIGGGYINTELRDLPDFGDVRIFDYVDFITLDDGELPLVYLIEYLKGKRRKDQLLRTLMTENDKSSGKRKIILKTHPHPELSHENTATPSYKGLPLEKYFSIFEILNPMHRIWSDGRWNKLTLAHGCYWRKCSFCDTSLDYIARYSKASADTLVDRIENIIQQTGQTGFHFVDEAAPPALLRELAERLLERKVIITWWGNVRFEKAFTSELTQLLARSGCIAISGGLEVASDRLLKLMNKGVDTQQVSQVTRAFTEAGILVHAYLMYGFPTQTKQETIDSLEKVRQLFANGCIQSAYWHRFSVTAHSPIGKNPEKFGISLLPDRSPSPRFARNDLQFVDPVNCDHDTLGMGLRKALYNYMHGIGWDRDVRSWFEG